MTDLFTSALHTEYARLVHERDKAAARHERHRASVLQRRIEGLMREILEAETGRKAA